MIIESYPDLTALWGGVTHKLLFDPEVWDGQKPPRLLSLPNLLIAETHSLDADLATVGFTGARWTRFINRYLELERYWDWVDRARAAHGVTSLLFRTRDKIDRNRDHTGGECIVAMSYRPEPSTLTIYSRETEFPVRGLLDAALAHLSAQAIRGGGPVAVHWLIGGIQVSLLHIIPYLATLGMLDEVMALDSKSGRYLRYMTEHLTKNNANLRYGPAKRMLKRWTNIASGNHYPSRKVQELVIPREVG